ncbi:MAG: hypothetical protein LBC86_03620 [Oscillospiraceae bacterium]|jgi:hypothetical protein|nr:hypothetical protein [Oscillospiraceae bacterium]
MKKITAIILACILLTTFNVSVLAEDAEGEHINENLTNGEAAEEDESGQESEPEPSVNVDCEFCGNDVEFCVCVPCEICFNYPCICNNCDFCGFDPCRCFNCIDCDEYPCVCFNCEDCGLDPCGCEPDILPTEIPEEPEIYEEEPEPEPVADRPAWTMPPQPVVVIDESMFDDSHRTSEPPPPEPVPEPEPEEEPEEEDFMLLMPREHYENPGRPSGGSSLVPLIVTLSLLIAGAGTAAPFVFKYYRRKIIYRY